jgi:NADH-quinone oxidoreductase subunit G
VHKTDVETAAAAVELLKAGDVALIGSAGSSVEEQFFYRLIADRSSAKVTLVSHTGEGDGILLSEDRTPNLRGALLNGLISKLPEADLTAVATEIDSGAIKTLVVVNEDVTQLGIPSELLAKVKVIYFGTHANAVSQVANVVCPSLMVYEKDGSFVNQSFRLQKFKAAVPGPRGIQSDVTVLEKIVAGLGEEKPVALTMDVAWERIADTMSAFEGLSWRGISDEGVALDPAQFIDLPFVETKNLKFDPVAFKEAQAASTEA